MPRFLILFIVSALTFLTACGGSDKPKESATVSPEIVEKILTRPSANGACFAPSNPDDVATTLSGTGCFTDMVTREPAPGVIPYTVNNLLWSDGEKKGRYFAIPDNTTITLVNDEPTIVAGNGLKNGNFSFPVGSVIIKHFFNGSRVVETRLLMRHQTNWWLGYSYEWNEAQTEATLLTGSKQITTPVSHYFPSPTECMDCHTEEAKIALGPDTFQLSYALNYTDGSEENFLDALDRLQYFDISPLPAYKDDHLYAINDTSATLEQRVRSYLHSNCSGCHRPGASLGGYIDMRYNASFEGNICGVAPQHPNSPGTALIEPGDKQASTIYRRLNSNFETLRMPPIGRATIDDQAVHVIGTWIDSLTSCQ